MAEGSGTTDASAPTRPPLSAWSKFAYSIGSVAFGLKAVAIGLVMLFYNQVIGLPAPTVQKLVSRLTAAGLLRSARGANGGLKLARPAAAISLADIVEAVEGPIALTACLEQGRHDCGMEDCCSIRAHWPTVNQAMRGALAGVSLTQLAGAAR